MRTAIKSILAVGLLTGCGLSLDTGAPATSEVPAMPMAERPGVVVLAEAVLEPAHASSLGFEAAGEVAEVLVAPGDAVAAGALLVRLDQVNARLGVKQAEADLEVAKAQLALLEAGARAEEIAAAQASLEAAQAAVERADAERDKLLSGATAAEIATASVEVAFADAERKVAQDAYDSDPPSEEVARYDFQAATQALAAAEARLAELRAGPGAARIRATNAGVQIASAERDTAQAQLELAQAGPTPEEVAVARLGVDRARVALETARQALTHAEVRAPFSGTVTAVKVEVGNAVVPGQVACTLATLDQLLVRTKDLSELDVAGVQPGQSVQVTVDALPDQEFDGIVQQIALRGEDFRGEAVFPVTVELQGVDDASLRWGMTAWVEF